MVKQYACLIALTTLCVFGGSAVATALPYGSGKYGGGTYNNGSTMTTKSSDTNSFTQDSSTITAPVDESSNEKRVRQLAAVGFGAMSLSGIGAVSYLVTHRRPKIPVWTT